MKKTAVEFLANELVKKGFPIEKYAMDLFEQAKELEKKQQGYSLDDLKEAYGMGRTSATIKDFNEQFKKK
jgi:predicted nucleic acid-binding protein